MIITDNDLGKRLSENMVMVAVRRAGPRSILHLTIFTVREILTEEACSQNIRGLKAAGCSMPS